MCIRQFFGQQSPFQIIVAVTAFVTGLYTLYKSFLERPRLALWPGDRLSLVVRAGGGVDALHAGLNLTNKSTKTGTLHRLEATLETPTRQKVAFDWQLFFSHVAGSLNQQPDSAVYPISVSGKTSSLHFIQFSAVKSVVTQWQPGTYKVEFFGWVNKRDRTRRSNLHRKATFVLDAVHALQLSSMAPAQPQSVEVAIAEWARR